jgi:hypothetical protein
MFALMGQRDMVGNPVGSHHLIDEFRTHSNSTEAAAAVP